MTISTVKIPSPFLPKFILCSMFFLFVAGQIELASAEDPAAATTMEITFRDQLISAELVDAPLIDVLQRIQQEFGFKAHFHGDLTERITLSFTDIPLMKCLRQLTVNQSLSVATQPTQKQPKENEAKQIAEIWVLSRSNTKQTVNIAPAAPVMPASGSYDEPVFIGEGSPGQSIDAQQEEPADQPVNSQNREESSKQQTIKDLAAIGDPASVLAMAEFTHDADKEIRQLSVSAIGSVESEESTRVLGQVLSDESDAEIRKTALRALAQRQHEATAKTLLEGALNDADAGVKTLAQQLLGQ